MVTKSRLFGGADTWSPNGVIPWGRNYENSLAWYADAGVFLTPMYAYEFEDSLSVSGRLDRLRVDPNYIDSMQLGGALLSAELVSTVVYTTYAMEPESFQIAGAFLDAELVTTVSYSNYAMEPEYLQLGGEFMGMSQQTVVVSYTNALPESVSVSGECLGAELS